MYIHVFQNWVDASDLQERAFFHVIHIAKKEAMLQVSNTFLEAISNIFTILQTTPLLPVPCCIHLLYFKTERSTEP